MHVVATAGHVDHGKSALIRALTGIETDRWEEEHRRGLTIDLGFAWTSLPSGREVAFVDVPGHERFVGNTLAGLGPAPVACFVVAADEGWQAQSADHRDALAALGIRHGVIALTRADRADPDSLDEVLAQARTELADTGLHAAPAVAVSAAEGTGLADLRATIDDVLAGVPPSASSGRVRLWVDRSFTIAGAGTVVTGTLAAGAIAAEDELQLIGSGRPQQVVVRGLESRGEPHAWLGPVNRVALNLRGVDVDEVGRGDALVTPDAWPTTSSVDVRRTTGALLSDVPRHLTVHVGTAAIPGRFRAFDDQHGRLKLARTLPLVLDDRLVLRDPGSRHILGGVRVLDPEPPALRRRGDGSRRARELAETDSGGDVDAEVARRGAVTEQHLRMLGFVTGNESVESVPHHDVRVIDQWWVHASTYEAWCRRLRTAVHELYERDPLAAGLTRGAARDLLGLPDTQLLDAVVADAGLDQDGGTIGAADRGGQLGPAEAGVAALEDRLASAPFRAPEAGELTALHLGTRQLAAAERAGRVLRLGGGVVLLPTAPALAMRELAELEQPFTTSSARQALGTTRRVAIPLLEHLDGRGWTVRLDAGHREVVR